MCTIMAKSVNNFVSSDNLTATRVNLIDNSAISNIYRLMDYYANNKLNGDVFFGKDEFPDDDSKQRLLKVSDTYEIQEKGYPSRLAGYIILSPSIYFRHGRAAYADVRFVLDEKQSDRKSPGPAKKSDDLSSGPSGPNVLSDLMKVAAYLALELDYEALLFETFILNVTSLLTARHAGYRPTATIPHSGYVFDAGWQDSVLLIREVKDIVTCLPQRKHGLSDKIWDKKYIQCNNFKIPIKFSLVTKDKKSDSYLINPAREEDAQAIHDVFAESAMAGEGFDVTEIETVEDILKDIRGETNIRRFTIKPVDPEASSELAGTIVVGPCTFVRSCQPDWAVQMTLISKKYQNTGITRGIFEVSRTIHHALAYRGIIADVFVNNKRSIKVTLDRPIAPISYAKTVGILPYVGYLKGKGWLDVILFCTELLPESKV